MAKLPGTNWSLHVARISARCNDCNGTIDVGDEYAEVHEYGEKRKLHRHCADLRLGRKRVGNTKPGVGPKS